MDTEQKILLGVDDSESARQVVTAAGALMKDRDLSSITLFYGAPDPSLPSLTKLLRLTPTAVEE